MVWPRPGEPLSKAVLAASPHRLVWLDLLLPDAAPRHVSFTPTLVERESTTG